MCRQRVRKEIIEEVNEEEDEEAKGKKMMKARKKKTECPRKIKSPLKTTNKKGET